MLGWGWKIFIKLEDYLPSDLSTYEPEKQKKKFEQIVNYSCIRVYLSSCLVFAIIVVLLSLLFKYNLNDAIIMSLITSVMLYICLRISLSGDLAWAYFMRSGNKRQIEDYKGAIEALNEAINLKPKVYFYYMYRAIAKNQLKDYKGAIEDYNQAINLESKDALLYIMRASSKIDLGAIEGAIEDYNNAKELDPSLSKDIEIEIIKIKQKRIQR